MCCFRSNVLARSRVLLRRWSRLRFWSRSFLLSSLDIPYWVRIVWCPASCIIHNFLRWLGHSVHCNKYTSSITSLRSKTCLWFLAEAACLIFRSRPCAWLAIRESHVGAEEYCTNWRWFHQFFMHEIVEYEQPLHSSLILTHNIDIRSYERMNSLIYSAFLLAPECTFPCITNKPAPFYWSASRMDFSAPKKVHSCRRDICLLSYFWCW